MADPPVPVGAAAWRTTRSALSRTRPGRLLPSSVRGNRLMLAALVLLLAVVLLAALAPVLPIQDPFDADPTQRSASIGTPGYLLGTDNQGRDILSRLLWGGRISLLVGLVPTALATLCGLLLGTLAGYLGGLADQIIMRVLDVFFAFPLVLLAIAIAGILSPGVPTEILAITIVLVPYISRLARTATAQVAGLPYVEAARASGAGAGAILVRYVLLNAVPPVLVYATTLAGLMIVVGSGLSFLGLGVQPPAADWGAMVGDGAVVLRKAAHVTILPGLMIVVTALAFNIIGDGLRDVLDPRT
ncbi:MAG TPA: ABC transporter permease [Xanthobacteraceae bacterium]|nr:ABC transporter permease [Xanthobacteraceae bacterium]